MKGWTEGKEGAMMESMALSEVVGAVLGFTMMTVEEVSERFRRVDVFGFRFLREKLTQSFLT